MLRIRRSADRGHFNHGWLDTYNTFSFSDYYDPEHMGFRVLRVMNEDRVAPGQGFGMHGHRDMEIVTYVLEGALEHKDSLGNGDVLRPGEFQRMTAGTGIRHSEFNPSATEPVHLYQIWIMPERNGLPPGYEQRPIDVKKSENRLLLAASRDGQNGSLTIRQDARLYLTRLDAGKAVGFGIQPGRAAWVQVLRGGVMVNGQLLAAGDGAALEGEEAVEIKGAETAEVMVFDLP
ncbi:MAG: pirin family protein [Planctomycetes bacterium]|nr:pirin family protein [Planctomycetota bacterium]